MREPISAKEWQMSNKRKSLTNSEMAMLTQGSELIERNTKRS
jgi:hypothetical protein